MKKILEMFEFAVILLWFLLLFSIPWFIFDYTLNVMEKEGTFLVTALWVPFTVIMASAFAEAKKKKKNE